MTNKKRAALWFLSDTDEELVEYKLQDLEEANENSSAAMIVNVWHPFQEVTVGKLLEEMDKLETQFDDSNLYWVERSKRDEEEIRAIKMKNISIAVMVRNLRDSDNHICPCHENIDDPDGQCTCGEYDKVIDKLND